MLRRIPWYRLSVVNALFIGSGVIAAQFLAGRNEVPDPSTACYWTIEILPFVECGDAMPFATLAEIFYNAWLLPLYGVAFAASIFGALFNGSLADGIRQMPGLVLIMLQVSLIIIFLWGSTKRLLQLVAYQPAK